MSPLTCHAILPAESTVHRGQSLNVLLVMESRIAAAAPVRFWGNDGSGWRLLLEEEREFPARSHPHLYFTIPAPRLSPDFWDGQAVEELALAAGETAPDPREPGVLVFFA